MIPTPPPSFGTRELRGRPLTHAPDGIPGAAPVARRRLRSRMVIIGCVGALALAAAAMAEQRTQHCSPRDTNDPNSVPDDCRGGHSTGHSYGFFGSPGSSGHGYASSASHASFGGFGSSGAGHGSGS